jgi:hypothetical protein
LCTDALPPGHVSVVVVDSEMVGWRGYVEDTERVGEIRECDGRLSVGRGAEVRDGTTRTRTCCMYDIAAIWLSQALNILL